MKKYLTFGAILTVIVLAHFIVIRMFFRGEKTDTAATTEKIDTVKAAAGAPVAVTKPEAPPVKFFHYKNAIDGNIPCLALSSEATSGILVDIDTRNVLWAKNPREAEPIASMTKMMTLLLAFEEMKKRPDITLETMVQVTSAASKIGGSQVYLDPKESFPLGELLKTIAIKSANDSAYQTAYFISNGDVAGFVNKMNERAKQLKMPSTTFVNPHGLPNESGENSKSSPEGMALLAEQLLEYPPLLAWTTKTYDSFRDKNNKAYQVITNTNKLVKDCAGVNGMKTGYIRASGFCITVTCMRGGKRLVAVVTGYKTSNDRNLAVRKLLDWGYRRAAVMDNPEELAKFDKTVTNAPSKEKTVAKKALPKKKKSAAKEKDPEQ
jgi:D-alanyl-D-alanine carboxypeptidase (penicillin-binding protein 5/6)